MFELVLITIVIMVWAMTQGNSSYSDEEEDKKEDKTPNYYPDNFLFNYTPPKTKSVTKYWENPVTGDYVKHKIDIEIID
jgi:hypothetical protein